MKGLLLLYGESFRLGGRGTRNRGSTESYGEQMKSAKTNVEFIEHLKCVHDCQMDVCISSYDTKFNNDLNAAYSDYLIFSDYYLDVIGTNQIVQKCIQKIENINKYDFVLILRIDICLKEEFIRIFTPKWDKIMFSFVCYKPHHISGGHPRVADMMMFIPCKYFQYMKYIGFHDYYQHGHDQWNHFINCTDLSYDDLDTMIDTFHDSDSEKDWNPLYYVVNRGQCMTSYCWGEVFNKKDYPQ
jgi:hypothetical protein